MNETSDTDTVTMHKRRKVEVLSLVMFGQFTQIRLFTTVHCAEQILFTLRRRLRKAEIYYRVPIKNPLTIDKDNAIKMNFGQNNLN